MFRRTVLVKYQIISSALSQAACAALRRGKQHSLLVSLFLGLDEGLLGDADAIKEFTLVLATDSANLLHLGAAEGESSVVDTIEDKLTLDVSGVSDGGALGHLDELVLLSTEEVLDGDAGAVLGDHDIDGEMSVYKSHLVAEAL